MISSKTSIDMIETGKRLKKLAHRSGYSVKDIQQYLGLSCPQPVYRWYKGVIDAEKMKQSNFEERIRAYYLKLVA